MNREIKTRITELLGIRYPIIQGGMSWASSSSALVIAVSNAGGLGVVAAGPMRSKDFRRTLIEIKAGTDSPWAVNVPLYNPRASEYLDIVFEMHAPILIASQGGPGVHLARFRSIGTKWLHVVTSVAHAQKSQAAGVDAIIAVGVEAGGHPAPSGVTTLVLVRRLSRMIALPIVASGGGADGAGIVALLALGADGVQMGTRFLATHEATVHDAYKKAVVAADVDSTTLVGRGGLPIRQLKNAFSERYALAETSGQGPSALEDLFEKSSLRQAALDGDIDWGKVEAGQSAGLIDKIVPVAELMKRLVEEMQTSLIRIESL